MADTELTEWQDVDLEAVDQQLKGYLENQNRQRANRPPKGRSVARGLPPRKDAPKPVPMIETYVHFIKHPDTGDIFAVGECPIKTGKGAFCAVCKQVSTWKRSGDPKLKALADDMAAKWHAYLAVVYLVHPENEVSLKTAQPEVVDVPHKIFQKLMKFYRDPHLGGNWSHPDTGFDLIFDRTGSTKNDTEYDVQLARQSSPIQNRAWLTKLPDLTAIAGQFQNAQVEAMFRGEAEAPGDFPPKDSAPALPPVDQGQGAQPTAKGEWLPPGAKR